MNNDMIQAILINADRELALLLNQHVPAKEELHILAVRTLFGYCHTFECHAKELIKALEKLESKTALYNALIAPFTSIVDDINMIAREYGKLYGSYLAERSRGQSDDDAVAKLFQPCKACA